MVKVRNVLRGVAIVVALMPDAHAQVQETAGDRQRLFSMRLEEIEDLIVNDLADAESADYAARLRHAADRFEAATHDKSIKISVLRNQLRRIQSSMGGAVVGGGKAYDDLMMRLQRDEIRVRAKIDKLSKE